MKKNVVKIIIAVIVLALLIGGIVILKMPAKTNKEPEKTSTTAAPSYDVYSEEVDNIKSISINSAAVNITASRMDDKWTVNNEPTDNVDTTKTRSLVESIAKITATSKVEDLSQLSEYGLDNPETTVTVNKNDGTSDKIFIGSVSPVSGDRFAMSSLDANVYTISSYKAETMNNPVSYYTEFSRFSMQDVSSIHGIKIERPDTTIEFTQDEPDEKNTYYASWTLTSPINTVANSDYISNNILQNISAINLTTPLTGGDYGFDKPTAKVTLTIIPYNKEKNEYEPSYTEEFLLGKMSEGNIYVSYKGKTYSVAASTFEFVNTTLLNMVSKIQSIVPITDVDSVIMSYGETTHTLDITHTDGDTDEQTFKIDGKDIDEDTAKKMYQELIGIQVDGLYQGQVTGERILSVLYKGHNGASDISIELKSVNELDCAFIRDGKIQFTVKKSVVNSLIDTINSYVK